VFFIFTGEGRKPAKTAQERADLLNSLIAYSGMYRLEGDKWITKVDVAWSPEFVGTEQTRFFRLEGNRLHVLTTWGIHPNWPEKGMQRRILTFERANADM
jgi:hypothetical protein